jgi:hypothetical protein
LKLPGSIGTSSTWCGYLSLLSSTCGEVNP